MFTKVLIYDIGNALNSMWDISSEIIQQVGLENIMVCYLHEIHLLPLVHDINRNYELFRINIVTHVRHVMEEYYKFLDREITLLQTSPSHYRNDILMGIRVIGCQLYLYFI